MCDTWIGTLHMVYMHSGLQEEELCHVCCMDKEIMRKAILGLHAEDICHVHGIHQSM